VWVVIVVEKKKRQEIGARGKKESKGEGSLVRA
jgi:hypothetical protein